ncbi:RagB/SusD family nutrient uptake outer membrane protein [Flavobacterium johnsoniae]|uniref:RagB/SusD family nutrient uptake outer membrane protein n=1 Tax=Flavobacterium sp. CFS9 TaxID=3143118 RepID=A0AAT9H6C2_9FLAO|nr:RagB/SusD family nutrient uptake outer membrane protein [Flavobacterium johnsoniae]WJS93532.1 RagB/SusD family nutrient uptake outer membrane protein [Flavobacterium johnsoniae]
MKKITVLTVAVVLWQLLACDSFVETGLPKSQLSTSEVFEDQATAAAALANIYAKIRDTGMLTGSFTGLSLQLGNYADETVSYENASSSGSLFYGNRLLPSTTAVQDYWNTSYNQIYASNALIEGVEKSQNLSPENKKQLKGEALFIRALVHFYLTNLFGSIPYITDTDYRKNSKVSRIDMQKVYEHILSDLNSAVLLLPTSYSTVERIRPNKWVCHALLSRVYLYSNRYAEASNEASAVLNENNLFSLEQDIDRTFLVSSKETIWQLQPAFAGQNTKEGSSFIFISTPPTAASLSPSLFDSFAANDLRKSHWIKAVSNGTSIWYHPFKYKERDNTAQSKEYSVLFRLAEQYLIRAEARARQGNLTGSKEDLNQIRIRAGLDKTAAVTADEIANAILQERRWEYFTELGHRFFDLKRLEVLDKTLKPVKAGWNSEDKLFPIPQTELITNPNLQPQNPGY